MNEYKRREKPNGGTQKKLGEKITNTVHPLRVTSNAEQNRQRDISPKGIVACRRHRITVNPF